MKKIISVLFAASLMFVVFACAQPKPAETTEPEVEVTDAEVIEENTEETLDTTVVETPAEEVTEEAPAEEVAE